MSLPKIGWMRYRKSRDIEGQPKNVTVAIVAGKVFVSIQTEREVEPVMHPSTSLVGVDWGVVNFVTMSNGEVVGQCAPLEQHARKLAKWQRRLARKKKFSNNWKKAKARISRLPPPGGKIRKGFVTQTSGSLNKNHGVCRVEGLAVK